MFNEKIPNTSSTEKNTEADKKIDDAEDKLLPILEGESLPEEIKNELGISEENVLPKEIRDWLEDLYANEEESPSKVLQRAISILEERNQINKTFPKNQEEECFYEEQFNGEIEETKEKMKKIIEEGLNNKMETLGGGMTATVVSSNTDPGCCYKIINNINNYRKGNNVKEETQFLDELADLEDNDTDTRTPRPYCYEMQKNGHLYVMEKLDAVTLGEIKKGKVAPPEGFEVEHFFKDLKKFIEKMHEKGIYHRDLSNGENIMVDKNDGTGYIIDFGLAKKTHMESEDPYREYTFREEEIKYHEDLESIEEHKKEFFNNS